VIELLLLQFAAADHPQLRDTHSQALALRYGSEHINCLDMGRLS
jgi:hypothetical protein